MRNRLVLGVLVAILSGLLLHFTLSAGDGPTASSRNEPSGERLSQSSLSPPGDARAPNESLAPSEALVPNAGSEDTADEPGTLSLTGTVTDAQGQPIEGVSVDARPGYRSSAKTKGSGTTDAQGRFRLRSLDPGLYEEITFEKPRFLRQEKENHLLSVLSAPLRVTLESAPTLEGLVVDAEGRPIPGVELFPLDAKYPNNPLPHQKPAWSGPDGTFTLDTLKASPWLLQARHPDFVEARQETSSPAKGVRVVMQVGASVEVSVLNARGLPVPRADVMMWTYYDIDEFFASPGAERSRRVEKRTQADEDGHAELRGFEPGLYELAAMVPAEEGVGFVMQRVELHGPERRRVQLRFDERQRLSGKVVDTTGQPVANVDVRVIPGDQVLLGVNPRGEQLAEALLSRMLAELQKPRRPTRTGPDGRFTLPPLPSLTWSLFFLRRGYSLQKDPGYEVEQDEALTSAWVRVPAGQNGLRVVLSYDGQVYGRVVDPKGQPLTSFELDHMPKTSPDGTFTLPAGQPGDHSLLISAPGLSGVRREYETKRGEDVDLGEVVLGAGRPVKVHVVDGESSAPIAGAWLELRDPARSGERLDPRELGLTTSPGISRDGTCLLPAVPAQPLLLTVKHDDYVEGQVTLGAEQREVTVSLRAGAILQGWVRAGGAPVRRAYLSLYTPRGDDVVGIAVEEGWYTKHALPPGRYIARVEGLHFMNNPEREAPEPIFLPRWIDIPEQGTHTIDFEDVRQGATLVVPGFEGLAWLDLVPSPWSPPRDDPPDKLASALGHPTRVLDEGPGYRFRHVPAGRYTLVGKYRRADDSVVPFTQEIQVPAEGTLTIPITARP